MLDINESWVSRGKWIIPESHSARAIGMSTDKEHDKMHYAEVYAIVHEDRHGRHTEAEVAARLLACVNACARIPTYQLIGENDEPSNLGEMIDLLRSQRDDLLLAARKVVLVLAHASEFGGVYQTSYDELSEAIANASK